METPARLGLTSTPVAGNRESTVDQGFGAPPRCAPVRRNGPEGVEDSENRVSPFDAEDISPVRLPQSFVSSEIPRESARESIGPSQSPEVGGAPSSSPVLEASGEEEQVGNDGELYGEGEYEEDDVGDDPGEEGEEEDESLTLARQLMEEESMLAYRQLQQATVQFALQQLQGGEAAVEDEDIALSLRLMREELQAHAGSEDAFAAMLEASHVAAEEGEEMGEGEDVDVDELSYEDLVRLGQELGDVKTDRWRLRSAQVIASLPTTTFCGVEKGGEGERGSACTPAAAAADAVCPICRCDYEDGETLVRLPCRHEFHAECASEWLKDHWECPLCKQNVCPSPPPASPGAATAAVAPPANPSGAGGGGGEAEE